MPEVLLVFISAMWVADSLCALFIGKVYDSNVLFFISIDILAGGFVSYVWIKAYGNTILPFSIGTSFAIFFGMILGGAVFSGFIGVFVHPLIQKKVRRRR